MNHTPKPPKATNMARRSGRSSHLGRSHAQARPPTKQKNEIGMKYFQQRFIIWSTRKRGSVQRIQMITKMNARILSAKAPNPRSCSHPCSAWSDAERKGTCQPPQKSIEATAPTTNTFTHSTSGKSAKRKPEYSVL